jgi:structural maintenance of chromosomes protein 6
MRAKVAFTAMLSKRAFDGQLKIDHKKQEMSIHVNPAGERGEGGLRKDPKSLSGGEKSYAQICLLLAVWEAMGSPIRALDELYFLPWDSVIILVTCSWMLSTEGPVWACW